MVPWAPPKRPPCCPGPSGRSAPLRGWCSLPGIPTEDYLNTREGKALPVPHCIRGSHGWQLAARLLPYASDVIDKPTFGSTALGERLRALNEDAPIESITLIGLCTDICVISNALLLRAYLPEVPIIVDAACCAGVTPESHRTALAAMRACQIIIENEPSV